jgi:AraC-like DNA-binding protein
MWRPACGKNVGSGRCGNDGQITWSPLPTPCPPLGDKPRNGSPWDTDRDSADDLVRPRGRCSTDARRTLLRPERHLGGTPGPACRIVSGPRRPRRCRCNAPVALRSPDAEGTKQFAGREYGASPPSVERILAQASAATVLESLVVFDRVFMGDPAGDWYGGSSARPTSESSRSSWLRPFVGEVRSGHERFDAVVREQVVPDGRTRIVFDVGAEPDAVVLGPSATAAALELSGTVAQVSIEIAPGAVGVVLGHSASSMRSSTLPLVDVVGGIGRRWLEQLVECPPVDRVRSAERLLARHLDDVDEVDARVAGAWRRIDNAGGRIGGDEVAAGVGLSGRRLQQLFADQVGLTPVQVRRLARFRLLGRLLVAEPERSLAEVSVSAGYADQAHASREVRQISGVTLAALRRSGFVQDTPAPTGDAVGDDFLDERTC